LKEEKSNAAKSFLDHGAVAGTDDVNWNLFINGKGDEEEYNLHGCRRNSSVVRHVGKNASEGVL
jgi:hypothetical protein